MAFILDNLVAVLVGGTLLVALLFVQQRGQQSAVEATTRYQAQQLTSGLVTTLERDVENIRTQAQTQTAFGAYRFTLRRETGTDGETYTSQFAFPTLQDPTLGLNSPVVIITYHIEPTGESARIDGTARPLYQATRYEYARGGAVTSTGTTSGIVDFEVTAYDGSGAAIQSRSTISPTPPRVHLSVTTAPDLPERRASDQAIPSTFAASRHARTVRVIGANAKGGSPPVDPTTPGGIPDLPGDPPPPPPPPPSTPSGGGGNNNGGSSGGGGNPPPSGPSYPSFSGTY